MSFSMIFVGFQGISAWSIQVPPPPPSAASRVALGKTSGGSPWPTISHKVKRSKKKNFFFRVLVQFVWCFFVFLLVLGVFWGVLSWRFLGVLSWL